VGKCRPGTLALTLRDVLLVLRRHLHPRPLLLFPYPLPSPPRLHGPDSKLVCRSDADAQLIVFVPFQQGVRIASIVVEAPAGEGPSVVKVWANRATLGFDDVEAIEPAQEFAPSEGDVSPSSAAGGGGGGAASGAAAPGFRLKSTRFPVVHNLFLFFDRADADAVAISKLAFFGSPVQAADVSAIKAQAHEH
jgi:hypothetical protein